MIPIQVKIGIAIALLALAAWGGSEWTDRGWQARIAEAERQATSAREELERKNEELIAAHASKEVKYVTKTKVVYKDIAGITGAARCIDDPELRFIERWNEAAGKTGVADGPVRGAGPPRVVDLRDALMAHADDVETIRVCGERNAGLVQWIDNLYSR